MVARQSKAKSAKSEQDALLEEVDSDADNFIDLSDVKAERFGGAVPAGRYLTEITAFKRGTTSAGSKNPGQPKLTITFNVLEDSDGEPFNGKIFLHSVLTGDQAGRARGYLEDLGLDLSGKLNLDDLVGIIAYLTVSVQKNNPGFNNVDKIELPDGGSDDELN